MALLSLLLSWLAASGFYFACAHQRLWLRARDHGRALRIAAALCTLAAALAAISALGVWAGVFTALTALMFGWVALPYLDGWRQVRKARADVG